MHYHLIVHRDSVSYQIKDMSISKERRDLTRKVEETINTLLCSGQPNILEIPRGQDPRKIPEGISSGDSVTLYGGTHGACLSGTLLALQLMDVKAEYHPEGFV